MLRNPPTLIRRIALLMIVIAVVRELSIRRNQQAVSEWPRRSAGSSGSTK